MGLFSKAKNKIGAILSRAFKRGRNQDASDLPSQIGPEVPIYNTNDSAPEYNMNDSAPVYNMMPSEGFGSQTPEYSLGGLDGAEYQMPQLSERGRDLSDMSDRRNNLQFDNSMEGIWNNLTMIQSILSENPMFKNVNFFDQEGASGMDESLALNGMDDIMESNLMEPAMDEDAIKTNLNVL